MTQDGMRKLLVCCAIAVLSLASWGASAFAQATRHIVWTDLAAANQGEHHDWVQQGADRWVETLPNGQVTRFTVIDAKSVLHGVKGETVVDPGRMRVFVPDVSDTGPYAKVLYYIDLSGDTQEWQVLGIFQEQR